MDDILTNLLGKVQRSLELLEEDMEKDSGFDPTSHYDRKNDYIARANHYGIQLMRTQNHFFAELHFSSLLRAISEYEETTGKRFNKGIVYANLGISQLMVGKITTGLANLLTAQEEDKPIDPNFNVLDSSLWRPFELQAVYDRFYQVKKTFQLGFDVDETFLDTLVHRISNQDRIFLEATMIDWHINWIQLQNHPNDYTLARLYSLLKDMCLLTETLLRKRAIQDDPNKSGERIDLYNLIEPVNRKVTGIRFPPSSDRETNNAQQFLDHLENYLDHKDVIFRSLIILYLVRNFTGHHFEVSGNIVSKKGRPFFTDLYEQTWHHVLVALLFFEHANAI